MAATLRASLLAALTLTRDLQAPLVAACDDSPPALPDLWTARDHLAHIAHYYEHAAIVLDAVRTGVTPPDDPEADLDRRNARVYAEHRDMPAAEVRARLDRTYDQLAQAIERCSDDDLRKPRVPGSDAEVWWLVPGCGWGHVGQHLAYWHQGRGDDAAAERAARRIYEIETTTFDDQRHLAGATYNLGCFYATGGRPDEALALVREALAMAPDLLDWARSDPDLVSIRDELASTPATGQ